MITELEIERTLNSKAFVKLVQDCLLKDGMTVLETIMAIQEKYNIHEDDLVEILKIEKTLTKYLYTECIKNNMLLNKTPSANIEKLF